MFICPFQLTAANMQPQAIPSEKEVGLGGI